MMTVKIRIHGQVQGVAYRYYTKLYADDLNLKGTVQNLANGSVEVYVTGEDITLARFFADLKMGSPYGQVSDIESEAIEFIDFKDFQILS